MALASGAVAERGWNPLPKKTLPTLCPRDQAPWVEVRPTDLDALLSRLFPAHEPDVALWNVESLGQVFKEGFVGASFDGRRCEPDLERFAMESGNLGALGSRLDVKDQQDCAVGGAGMPGRQGR